MHQKQTDLFSFVHSLISKRGQALHFIFERLNRAMDQEKSNWDEKEGLKSVSENYQVT